MARFRRLDAPDHLHHLISRFVDTAFRLDHPGARSAYLDRVPKALGRSDWTALGYALMSSHIHWVAWSGDSPPARFLQSLHVGFARWLNREAGTRGPVFAERFRDVVFQGETAATLLAYVHNNPVRAGLVAHAADSAWTTHRAYLGLEPPPPWLDVEAGLLRCGFEPTTRGRMRFDDFVRAQAATPRSALISGKDLDKQLRQERAARGPVELASPTVTSSTSGLVVRHTVVEPRPIPRRPRAQSVTVDEVLAEVAATTGISEQRLRSGARDRQTVAGRRLAFLVWAKLRRPAVDITRALGVGKSAAVGLLTSAERDTALCAELIADALTWPQTGGETTELRNTVPG